MLKYTKVYCPNCKGKKSVYDTEKDLYSCLLCGYKIGTKEQIDQDKLSREKAIKNYQLVIEKEVDIHKQWVKQYLASSEGIKNTKELEKKLAEIDLETFREYQKRNPAVHNKEKEKTQILFLEPLKQVNPHIRELPDIVEIRATNIRNIARWCYNIHLATGNNKAYQLFNKLADKYMDIVNKFNL